MKHLVAIFLLTISLSAFAHQGENHQPLAPEKQQPNLSTDECKKLYKQLGLLSKVIDETDKKLWEMRRAMDLIWNNGIFAEFETYEPFDPATLVRFNNAWQVIAYEHSKYSAQRIIAYDAREIKITEMKMGCNYMPGGTS